MENSRKERKPPESPSSPKYVYYILCKKCRKVNVPDDPGYCPSCLQKEKPHDNYHPKPTADYRTKKYAAKCGGLPWIYRGRREDKEMCHLRYENWEISVQRQKNRMFCYIVGNKEFSVFRKNITELVFARTRSVRHLAKLLNMSFDELCEKIKESTPAKVYEK